MMVQELLGDTQVNIIPFTTSLFDRALALYADRPDKEWGMVDCTSFVIMQDMGIQEALAHDKHFVQGGFAALLRAE